jgi:hypothetical protein
MSPTGRIAEGPHAADQLVLVKGSIVGAALLIRHDAVDGLGDVVLKMGPDCVDGGFFLCRHLSDEVRVTGEQERIPLVAAPNPSHLSNW